MGPLLAIMMSIIIGLMSIGTYSKYQNASNQNVQASIVAQQAQQFNAASISYIQNYATNIQAVATASTPAIITVAMLQSTNLLPSTFSATNAFGQTWQLEVLQPSAGNLTALAMTTGGTSEPDMLLAKVASLIGASGGFIPKNDSGIFTSGFAYGSMSGWQQSTTNFSSVSGGEIASLLTFNAGQLVDNRLYRNLVPGQPQLNTMNTPIIMASTQTIGASCTSIGAIAQDGTGAVISCQTPGSPGTWQSQGSAYWKDPVANFASLPTCNASIAWQTRVVKTPTTGTGPRAYTCDSATWQALAVNDSGNMTIAGTMTVGMAQLNTVVTEGTACSPNGLVARDSTGLILSCQSGVWTGPSLQPKSYITSFSLSSGSTSTLDINAIGAQHHIYGSVATYGGGNRSGIGNYWLLNTSGTTIYASQSLGGTNIYSGNDGGSGMYDSSMFVIPIISNTRYVVFQGAGSWGASFSIYAVD
jgi:Bacterial shufflon protein, N-terminal constant region